MPYKHILIAVDLTEDCHAVIQRARDLAQCFQAQLSLTHTVEPMAMAFGGDVPMDLSQLQQQQFDQAKERMDRLLSELLTLSRLESGMVEHVDEPVDVAEVLGDVISDAGPQATQAGCVLVFDGGGVPAWVKGDAELLHRVFDNLLRNALTHAASGKWVRISVAENDGSVCVRVEDRGPGVLSSETEQIFKPFFRSARSAGVNGHGLGLVIARQIVENHGGRIAAENRSEGGLCFSVFLPSTAL